MESGGKQYYYNFDALGSVTELTDSGGNIVESYEYDVYGKPVIRDANGNILNQSIASNPYLFTGRRCDCDSDVYYYRARDYSPKLGRFIQPDPIGYVDSANLYPYVLNNPVNLTDPKGLFVTDIMDVGFWYWSYRDFVKCPGLWTGASLALDTISLLPAIPSLGWITKFPFLAKGLTTKANSVFLFAAASLNKIDKTYDAIRGSKRGIEIASTTTRKGLSKVEYLFKNRNEAMNYARKQLGHGAERVYNSSGKWIGWQNKVGDKVYWGHGDWGKGLGKSKFPHLNYSIGGKQGHYFLQDKIRNRGMWDSFVRELKQWK